jgi:protein-tyrosine-phosphatase
MPDVPEDLFVCTHNAGRSQMAAALLNLQAAQPNPCTGQR